MFVCRPPGRTDLNLSYKNHASKLTICEDTLFHGETLLVIASRDAEDVSLPFLTKGICFYFMAHALLKENTQFLVIIKLKELLAPRCGVGHV